MKVAWRSIGALLTGLALVPGLAAAQQGAVTGQVVDAETQQPLEGAQVQIEGTSRGSLTNQEGRYLIQGLTPGERDVRVVYIGYRAGNQSVTVQPGETAVADFELIQSAIAIDALTVTATGQQRLRREIGSDVALVEVGEMNLAPVQNFDQLLQSRTPGMTVIQSSGQAGSGSRIRIRGNSSISLSNSPLVIIDGVRINDDPSSFELFTGGQETSRLNDLNPEEIQSIEVLKGPAASALYGTAAANGVIQIQTRSGREGPGGWRFWAEGSVINQSVDFPDNVLAVDSEGARCDIVRLATAGCTQAETFAFNPLENEATTPFRTGWSQRYGAAVSGQTENASYFVSGEWNDETGFQIENTAQRVSLRANVTGQVAEDVSVSARVGYTDSDAQLPQNDNSGLGLLLNGMLGSPDPGSVEALDGYRIPFSTLVAWDQFQDVTRSTFSGQLDWQPLEWLRVTGVGGVDDVSRHDNDLVQPGELAIFGSPFAEGFRESFKFDILNWTATGDATADWQPTQDIGASTSAGLQYFRDRENWIFASGDDLLPGTGSLAGASTNFQANESNIENITFGTYLQQRFDWQNRIFLNLGLRGDQNSAFGENLGWVWYPSVSGSWVISEEAFFPEGTFLDELRLRAAWGESGRRPGFRDAKQFFQGITAVTAVGEAPGFVIDGAGNPELEPESEREIEVGFEAGMLDDRLSVELTYYDKRTEDALVSRTLAPSLGATDSRIENIGAIENSGVEFTVGAEALRRPDVNWYVEVNGWFNDNEVTSLGGVPPIVFGLLGNTQEHREGFAPGSYFHPEILGFEDANGDGLIGPDEVQVGEREFLGEPNPTREFQISTDLRLWNRLTVTGLLHHAGGHQLFNGTRWDRCANTLVCREAFDPDAPLATQAAIMAWSTAESAAGFIEDGDFWKLREVSLTYDAPSEWASAVGGQSLRVTLAGRNLATWSDYEGLDPELNGAGQAEFNTFDLYTLPPMRTFALRFDVSF